MTAVAEIYALYLATGAVTGLLAGLLGIGGGLIMVPALLACFPAVGVPAASIPALALGTSLTTICVSSLLASHEHVRVGNLSQPFSGPMPRLMAWLAIGVLAGTALATRLPVRAVVACVAVFQIFVASRMLHRSLKPQADIAAGAANANTVETAQSRLDAKRAGPFFVATGALCSIAGIAGTSLMVPYFRARGIEHRKAAALATWFNCIIGALGFVSYGLLAGPDRAIPMALGYVSLPALAGLAFGTSLFVRYGARLSRRLPPALLMRGFCCFLYVSGGKALFAIALSPAISA